MTCEHVKMPGGITAIVCSRGRRGKKPKACAFCGKPSSLLCDFKRRAPEISGGVQRLVDKTCDKPLCVACAVSVGEDLDHCPDHKPRAGDQLGLGL